MQGGRQLRFATASASKPAARPRDATKPGPVCAQLPYNKPVGSAVSEDCLTLNVTTPRGASAARPVMVFLHGGDLTSGSGSQFEPRRMAAQGDVVVVTVNYRLGIFGFFGHAGLPGSGTFGLQDQQAALRWVRRNAAAFGGDARNVTLFGQSAGAISTCGQLTSPAAKGLYDKVIIQSASCGSYTPTLMPGRQAPATAATDKWKPLATVDAQGGALAGDLGCADEATAIACLRGLPTDRLLPHTEIGYWTAFARAGAPAADGAPAWTAYAPGTRHVQTLAPTRIGSVDDATEHQCAFWQTAE
ncbi:carboxylesterase family protein [Actinoallomurus sp. WRP6H-15]|nr:carboxylesterase family protein [Actinoallomurus soli]